MSSSGESKQVVEAIQSLVDFHEGSWKGKATSFTVTPDIAAGIVARKTSPEYTVSVKLGRNKDQDYSLTESLSWGDHFSSRSLGFSNCNVDVDSVDASYSLDSTLPDIPSAITGTDKLCQFGIEHCIAASDDRRMRLLVFYGVDQSILRLVVCDETRVKGQQVMTPIDSSQTNKDLTIGDLLEMQSDVDRLVDKIAGGLPDIAPVASDKKADAGEDRFEKLQESVSPTSADDGSQKLLPYIMSLVEQTSGVWIGDAVIRDIAMVAASPERGRGFGSSDEPKSTIKSQPFGSWSVGVQKLAWRWMWNFGEEVRQVVDVGKAMGVEISDCASKSLSGSVCVNESLSRRVPKDQRMVFIDWSGDNVGFMLGNLSIQVPRYLNFDRSGRQVKPFVTEFGVYQSTVVEEDLTEENVDKITLPEVICSKISRIYNFEGQLKQGCTSFCTLKRFGEEIE
jgi:hypothetical protein